MGKERSRDPFLGTRVAGALMRGVDKAVERFGVAASNAGLIWKRRRREERQDSERLRRRDLNRLYLDLLKHHPREDQRICLLDVHVWRDGPKKWQIVSGDGGAAYDNSYTRIVLTVDFNRERGNSLTVSHSGLMPRPYGDAFVHTYRVDGGRVDDEGFLVDERRDNGVQVARTRLVDLLPVDLSSVGERRKILGQIQRMERYRGR